MGAKWITVPMALLTVEQQKNLLVVRQAANAQQPTVDGASGANFQLAPAAARGHAVGLVKFRDRQAVARDYLQIQKPARLLEYHAH